MAPSAGSQQPMKPALLFDLGNTLAAYYHKDEFDPILRQAISDVRRELDALGLAHVLLDQALAAALRENSEAPDHRFTPMVARLERIFDLSLQCQPLLAAQLCETFLSPIFARGRVYDDVLPALDRLRGAGFATAIVSNTPWGSPSELWRLELERLGLADSVDHAIFCGDAGWRKPALAIFDFAAAVLERPPSSCVFVGDDVSWDIMGSEAAGMSAVLIDRDNRHSQFAGSRIESLAELADILAADFGLF